MNALDIKDSDGDVFTIQIPRGGCSLNISSRARYIALERANAAQLWPILRHFAETGELCETPTTDAPQRSARVDSPLTFTGAMIEGLVTRVLALEKTTEKHEERMDITHDDFERRIQALEETHAPGSAHSGAEQDAAMCEECGHAMCEHSTIVMCSHCQCKRII